jgi:hypothetical protein
VNLGRRVVVSLALAAALAVVASALTDMLVDGPAGGWSMYDPNGNSVPFGEGGSDGDTLVVAAIWLVAIAVWFGVAWRLFRSHGERSE